MRFRAAPAVRAAAAAAGGGVGFGVEGSGSRGYAETALHRCPEGCGRAASRVKGVGVSAAKAPLDAGGCGYCCDGARPTSLIRNRAPLRPYSRTTPSALW